MISTPLSNIASNLIHQRAKDIQGNDFSKVENDIVHRSGHYDIVIQDSHNNQQKTWEDLEKEEKILLAQAISGQTAFNWLFDTLTAFLHGGDTSLMIIFTPPNDVSTSIMNPLLYGASRRPRISLSYDMTSRTVTVKTSCEHIRQRTIDIKKGTNKDEELSIPLRGSYTYQQGSSEDPFSDISIVCDLEKLGAHDLPALSSSTEDGLLTRRATLAKFLINSMDVCGRINDMRHTTQEDLPKDTLRDCLNYLDSVLAMINGMLDSWEGKDQVDITNNFKISMDCYKKIYRQLKTIGPEDSTKEFSLIQLFVQELFDDFNVLERDNILAITSKVDAIIQMIRSYSDGGCETKLLGLNGLSLFQMPAEIPIDHQADKKRSCCCLWPFS